MECPALFDEIVLQDGRTICKLPPSYSRGSGHTVPFHESEAYGGHFYPKCVDNFEPSGCCVCAPVCPRGMFAQYVHNLGNVCFLDEPMEHEYIRELEFHH